MFRLDDRRAAWAEEVRALARERLAPLAAAGPEGRVDRALVAALGEAGLIARVLPEGRACALDLCVLREALARECTEAETALALQGLGAHPLRAAPEVAARWLPEVVAGRAVAAFALTEEGAGSDAAALALAAEPDGPGRWRLTGEKCWISNAPDADVYTVFARTGPPALDAGPPTPEAALPAADAASVPEAGPRDAAPPAADAASAPRRARGVTAFAVPADRPGLGGEPLDMLAPHAIGRLTFDAVPVTAADLLGEEGHGFRVAMATLDLFRPSVGAFAVGMAQAALDLALAHAARRTAFGGPLKDLQAVAHPLAEMATRTEAARLLVHAAAAAHDAGAPDVTRRAAMAKLFATETAQYVVDAAVQIHGARALRRGHRLEQLYREVRAPRIYEGATEVQRSVIARELYR
jgi:alkylation response protein AidB-like acyl-CoA dehydrogenase